jgi:hypothetical protein
MVDKVDTTIHPKSITPGNVLANLSPDKWRGDWSTASSAVSRNNSRVSMALHSPEKIVALFSSIEKWYKDLPLWIVYTIDPNVKLVINREHFRQFLEYLWKSVAYKTKVEELYTKVIEEIQKEWTTYYSTKSITAWMYREQKLSPSVDIPSFDAMIRYINTLFYTRYGVLAIWDLWEVVRGVQEKGETAERKEQG